MVGPEHVREEGVDSRREQHASCLAVCLLPFLPVHSPCCFALGGVWAWAICLPSPWAEDLGHCELS